MYSANELAVKFGFHPLFCQSLVRTIPQSWRKLLNKQERVITVENTSTQELLRTKKVVRWAYLNFIRKTEIRIACEKWQDELKLPRTHNWDMVFNRTYIVSDDRKLGYSFSACIGSYRQTSACICMGLSKQINVDIVQCTPLCILCGRLDDRISEPTRAVGATVTAGTVILIGLPRRAI